MDSTRGSMTANITSSAANSSSSTPDIKKRGQFKKRGTSFGSKSAYSAPALDIVSGFAFLSFSNVQDLERHIEEHEVKTQSLSISVGQKRKKQPISEKIEKIADENVSTRCTSKRIKIPSQKILESYATRDIPIRQLVPSNDPHTKQHGKTKSSPGEKTDSSNSQVKNFLTDIKKEPNEKSYFPSCSLRFHNSESKDSDISLECSEIIDVCMFDDEDVGGPLLKPSSHTTEVNEKKHKKKKRKKNISDQTCQTMFRIKKKKQTKNLSDSTPCIVKEDVYNNNEGASRASQENSQIHPTDLGEGGEISSDVTVNEETKVFSPAEQYQQMQATKYFDVKYPRPTFSNKVEKINYCARSGGVDLVERYHDRQKMLKEIDASSNTSGTQQFPPDKDSQDSCDTSFQSDNLSDYSGNESSTNSSIHDQDGLPSNKSRIFAGSTSLFMSSVEEPNNESEVDVGSDTEEDATFLPISVVKALPKNYLFGHYSTYPDKTTTGTVDVNIQIYENDIQLYMNYASDFEANVIKIITPDNEESSKNTNICLPHSATFSGVPKFLQPQEYVKAVRSATERNRRHNLGDLFRHLKSQIFDDVEEFHFSKQAILSKALEVLTAEVQQSVDFVNEKEDLIEKNKKLRKSLNDVLFGEDHDLQNKQVDLDKVNEFLKTLNIEVKSPDIDSQSSGARGKADTSESSCQSSKNVTKKGRPPLEGKFSLRKKHIMSPPSPPDSNLKLFIPKQLTEDANVKSTNAVINNKVKGFIAIVPFNTENKEMSVKKEKVEIVTNEKATTREIDDLDMAPVSKIVCNISSYRLRQTGELSGMTLVTNPEKPLKAIQSKNVVHIKISNDTMKCIGGSGNDNLNMSANNNAKTVSTHDDTNLYQRSKSLTQSKSLSTQTDLDDKPQPTDCNANTLKLGQRVVSSSASTSNVNPVGTSQSKSLLPIQSMVTATKDVKTVQINEKAVSSSQSKQLLPKPPVVTATSSNSNPLGSSQNVYLLPKLPTFAPTPSNVHHPGSLQKMVFLPKPSTTIASTSKVNIVKPAGSSPNVLLVPQPYTTAVTTSTIDTVKDMINPDGGPVLLPKPTVTASSVNTPGSSQNILLQPIPCTVTVTTTNVITAVKSSVSPAVSSILSKPSTATASNIALKPSTATASNITLKPTTATASNITLKPTTATASNIALKPTTATASNITLKPTTATASNITLKPTTATASNITLKLTTATASNITLKPTAALKRLVDILKGRTLMAGLTSAAKPQTYVFNSQCVTTKPAFTIASPGCVSKANAPHSTVRPAGTSTPPAVGQVTNNMQPTVEVKTTTLLQAGVPLSIPVTMTTTAVPLASPMTNMVKQGVASTPLDQRYVTVIPSANASSQPVNLIPSSSVPSSSAVRIIFKPTGKPIRTPFEQVKGALQSQMLMRLPIARASTAPLQTSIPVQQNNPVLSTTNALQAPSVQFLLRRPSSNMPVQHNTVTPQLQQSLRATSPQISFSKPLVRIQPSPTNPNTVQQVIIPVNHRKDNSSVAIVPLSSSAIAAANNSASVCAASSMLINAAANQPKQLTTTYTSQLVLKSGNMSVADVRSQHLFNQIPPKKSMLLPATQSGMGAGPFAPGTFQSNPQQSNPVAQKTGTTSISSGGPKKTIFSEMEKMVAKIPSPQLQSLTNNVSTTLNLGVTAPSCSQGLSLPSQMVTDNTTNAIINSTALQISTACSNVRLSAQTSETAQSKGCLIAEGRTTMQSNIPATSTQTSVTHSNACSSGSTSFQVPEPKQHDKTCSVVESPEDNSHVVTADALSVCNIDSSIPDITSELQGNQQNSSVTGRLFGNITEQNLKDPCGNVEGKQDSGGFVAQDESTAEDFDLLASLDDVEQCF